MARVHTRPWIGKESSSRLITKKRGQLVPDVDPEFCWLATDDLDFDPDNPRFLNEVDGSDMASILKFMIDDAGLIELTRSIASQGFFPGEPLLVSPHLTGRWIVVEGNRRLAATKLILDPTLALNRTETVAAVAALAGDRDFTQVPCLVFDDRPSILQYLGYRHVTGIKEWSPLAKARFLRQRFDQVRSTSDQDAFRVVARTIGSRSDYVGRLLTANELFERVAIEDYFGIEGLSESTIEFSLITSLLAYSAIVDFIGLDSSSDLKMENLDAERLEFLIRFVFHRQADGKTRLRESRNIGKLAEVLQNDRASAALIEGSNLGQASQFLGTGADVFRTLVGSAVESLLLAQKNADGVVLNAGDVDRLEQISSLALELQHLPHELRA
jgi:hypothetical protein